MKRTIGVILSGCGVMDGSEIHEATLTLYFIDKHGAEALCMAPDKEQADVVDHLAGAAAKESRNVLREAARIARGKIRDVRSVKSQEVDAVILPGGFGAAKNLCTFARDGADCTVDPDVARLLKELHAQRKPIGALCIAPALLAKLFGKDLHPELTIGNDSGTAAALESMGARHRNARTYEIVVDEAARLVTTPCYMTAKGIAEVGAGAEKLVTRVLEMI